MTKAKKVKQIQFMMSDQPGRLSEITAALAAAKVNISNICAYGMQQEATFMLTVDSNAKAKKALAPLGVEIKEYDVVIVAMPNKPGELQRNSVMRKSTSSTCTARQPMQSRGTAFLPPLMTQRRSS
jgi:hypothetical protein